jgi:hypothetical protein
MKTVEADTYTPIERDWFSHWFNTDGPIISNERPYRVWFNWTRWMPGPPMNWDETLQAVRRLVNMGMPPACIMVRPASRHPFVTGP